MYGVCTYSSGQGRTGPLVLTEWNGGDSCRVVEMGEYWLYTPLATPPNAFPSVQDKSTYLRVYQNPGWDFCFFQFFVGARIALSRFLIIFLGSHTVLSFL